MNNIILSFIITGIAGISTLIGTTPIFLKKINKYNLINISLSISSGVMASVSFFSLIPESFNYFNKNYTINESIFFIISFVTIGIIITKIINNFFDKLDNKLYKLGIISMIALIFHNIPEGILTFSISSINISLGLSLAFSILLHNIPEGISISIPIYYATNNYKKAILFTSISGFSEILGAFITYIFLYKYINNSFISIILSLTSGIMIYISIFELLKEALKYNKKRTIMFFIISFIFMLIFN